MQIIMNVVYKSIKTPSHTVAGVSLIQAEVYGALSWCAPPSLKCKSRGKYVWGRDIQGLVRKIHYNPGPVILCVCV